MKLKVKDISKNYNRYSALRGVNLELEPGLYGLLGPNGAGKSTLLKIIAGILRPTAGSILLDNEPVSKLGEHYRAMLGYMPQDLGIYPEFTAKRYLLYIAALKGLTEAQAKAEIDKLLEAVGLSSNAEQKLIRIGTRSEVIIVCAIEKTTAIARQRRNSTRPTP
jgi:ABC-2 type transport system ATP-binding protein